MCFRVCHLTDDVIALSYSGALQRPESKAYRAELQKYVNVKIIVSLYPI